MSPSFIKRLKRENAELRRANEILKGGFLRGREGLAKASIIVYRRCTMIMDRATAQTYASWFRCVADPTRLQILHLLASEGKPMKVGEISSLVGVAQSTASVHLQRLLDDEFVLVDHSGTTSWFNINASCIEQFPVAAQQVMGALSGSSSLLAEGTRAPWQRQVPY